MQLIILEKKLFGEVTFNNSDDEPFEEDKEYDWGDDDKDDK